MKRAKLEPVQRPYAYDAWVAIPSVLTASSLAVTLESLAGQLRRMPPVTPVRFGVSRSERVVYADIRRDGNGYGKHGSGQGGDGT